jgi:hypothetical protein
MSLFRTLARMFIGDPGDPTMLDHVPVTGAPDWRQERLQQARQRYGKPFAPDIKTSRVTPPSHVLTHIQNQTEAAKKVTDIATRRRK